MILFPSKPGVIVKLGDPATLGSVRLLSVEPKLGFGLQRSIITRLTVSQQTNIQFLHSLGSQIFVYVFGDRMGTITLSGLSSAAPLQAAELNWSGFATAGYARSDRDRKSVV